MGFKMKGINSLTRSTSSNSPLLNTDPEIKNTEFTTTKDGEKIPVARTITKPGDREVEKLETDPQAYLDSFTPEFTKAKEKGFDGTLPEYIKQKEVDLGYAGSEVDQVRDYSVEEKPEYKIDKNTGKSYIRKPHGDPSKKIYKREYHYPTYNTGHHEKGTLVSENEMLGNLREKFDNKKANEIYEDWILRNTGKPVKWKKGSTYSRSGGGGQSDNLTQWIEKQNN